METRRLGKEGPQVPIVCLGAWPIGGGMGLMGEDQAIRTVQAAIDVGMTFIDTAESYRNSESLIGRAIEGQRDRVFLATKLSGNDHSPNHLDLAVENSLRALSTDYIDLYQLHSPEPQWPIEETMGHLLDLRDRGLIRFIGISNFSAEQTPEALKYGPVHSSQPRYSMLFREAAEAILPCCLETGIGVIPHSVLAKGMLSGRYPPGHQFTVYDERSSFEVFQGEDYERMWAIIQRLNEWADDHGRDLVQLAIAWVLANPAVTSAIVGAKTPEQVYHNARAADWRLSSSDMEEIDSILNDAVPSDGGPATPVAEEAEPPTEAPSEIPVDEAAEDSEIYTQLLLGLHQDLETQERRLVDNLREFDALKGQVNALRSLWITTLAAIIIGTAALVVAILQ